MDLQPELVIALLVFLVGYSAGRPSNVRRARVRKVRQVGSGAGDEQHYRVELSLDLPEKSGRKLRAGKDIRLLLR